MLVAYRNRLLGPSVLQHRHPWVQLASSRLLGRAMACVEGDVTAKTDVLLPPVRIPKDCWVQGLHVRVEGCTLRVEG